MFEGGAAVDDEGTTGARIVVGPPIATEVMSVDVPGA